MGYIAPENTHIGVYDHDFIILPINGLIMRLEIAPAVPDKPTMVDVDILPKISDMAVI